MLSIVVAQRDRTRAKAATLEEAAAAAAAREAAAVAQVAKLQADNDALYERVRFVEGYAASQVCAPVVGAITGVRRPHIDECVYAHLARNASRSQGADTRVGMTQRVSVQAAAAAAGPVTVDANGVRLPPPSRKAARYSCGPFAVAVEPTEPTAAAAAASSSAAAARRRNRYMCFAGDFGGGVVAPALPGGDGDAEARYRRAYEDRLNPLNGTRMF